MSQSADTLGVESETSNPLGPDPGNWVKILLIGVDVIPLYGVEGDVGIFFGRDPTGRFQAGWYVEGGHGPGFAGSIDFLGFDFVTGLDTLDRSHTINLFLSAGPVTAHADLDRPDTDVALGVLNGVGASFSVGPFPVEGGATFTTTRIWTWIGDGP